LRAEGDRHEPYAGPLEARTEHGEAAKSLRPAVGARQDEVVPCSGGAT
jgi:hypothetical protein